jgi:hypothetical protein
MLEKIALRGGVYLESSYIYLFIYDIPCSYFGPFSETRTCTCGQREQLQIMCAF